MPKLKNKISTTRQHKKSPSEGKWFFGSKKTEAWLKLPGQIHWRRLAWFGLLIGGLLFIQLVYNVRTSGQPKVLGYATSLSQQALLNDTNQYRASVGLPPLHLNDQLSRGAQNKAQHMIDGNYWSHVAPDGTAPWFFFKQAGYNYKTAGENLAYGFSTDGEVISAWINSPEHRANMLGKYIDVGFGYANGDHYQNGQNTVVVALYATPASQNSPSLASNSINNEPPTQISNQSSVKASTIKAIMGGSANWAIYASLGLIIAATFGFVITHLELIKLGWYKGRKFVALHPLFDGLVLLGVTLGLVHMIGGFVL